MKRRDRKGRYIKVSKFEKYVLASVMGVILFGFVFEILNTESVVVHVAEAQEIAEPVAQEVMIEVVYDWTRERIEQEVLAVFPDAPIMLKVVQCESEYKLDAHNPTNNSHDRGLLQISDKYHKAEWTKLGFTDMNDPIQNLAYGRVLYDEQGLAPWIWSKPCWSK